MGLEKHTRKAFEENERKLEGARSVSETSLDQITDNPTPDDWLATTHYDVERAKDDLLKSQQKQDELLISAHDEAVQIDSQMTKMRAWEKETRPDGSVQEFDSGPSLMSYKDLMFRAGKETYRIHSENGMHYDIFRTFRNGNEELVGEVSGSVLEKIPLQEGKPLVIPNILETNEGIQVIGLESF